MNTAFLEKSKWSLRSSGSPISEEIVSFLEEEWFDFIANKGHFRQTTFSQQKTFSEGTSFQALQTRYERNIYARKECLDHHGYSCAVCDFNFEKFYGNIGHKFIHVHHLVQVSSIGKEYEVNPVDDLCPVCPNCHAMLHKQNPPLKIGELRELISVEPSIPIQSSQIDLS